MLLSKAKGATNMKERKIITIGCPNLDTLTKTEAKIFYSTLLSAVIEYYKDIKSLGKSERKTENKQQRS